MQQQTIATTLVTRIIALLCCTIVAHAQTARDHAVELRTSATDNGFRIEVDGARSTSTTRVSIRGLGAYDWIDVPLPEGNTGIDVGRADGTTEVRWLIDRTDTAGKAVPADGYAMIRTADDANGKRRVLLIADTQAADALEDVLARYRDDLRREGWSTELATVPPSRHHAQAPQIRSLIREVYQRPLDIPLSHVILIGAIPIPYSGGFSVLGTYPPPDGHEGHGGAWASDCYYADMEIAAGIDAAGAWTDAEVDIADSATAYWERNVNVPGDGKFDQCVIPSDVELAIGRVDMADMPAFGTMADDRRREFELLRRYFDKNHRYRTQGRNIPLRALIDDNFHGFIYEEGGARIHEAFAASAWRSWSSAVDTFVVGDWVPETPTRASLDTMQCLLSYACGGGGFEHCSYVATTQDLVQQPLRAPITLLFGSYFGDVAARNNIMRAVIAADGDALACGWSGRPHWFLHTLAAGETIGDCLVRTQNNAGEYRGAAKVSSDDATISAFDAYRRGVHIQLVGDPTLRLPGPAMPSLAVQRVDDASGNAVDVEITCPDSAKVVIEQGPTADGPWTDAAAVDLGPGERRIVRLSVSTQAGLLRARPYRAADVRGSRLWTNIWGRGTLTAFGPATGVCDVLPDNLGCLQDLHWFDLMGRPISAPRNNGSAGTYLWRSGAASGISVFGFGR
ncbi:MAG: hypothetical protein FGM24_01655 [Candidatus Kapabacteria bacterium]|nr:hypothetical protein [Candidatus Kapabacteria bacterium]